MNFKLLAKGVVRRQLWLWAILSGVLPMASRAAVPPGIPAPMTHPEAKGEDNGNPYSVISERNIFHLNPPPPPPEMEKPKVELPVVKITGFLNIGERTHVLFMAEPKDKKDRAYYSLAEGEKSPDGKLKLIHIHPAQDAVDVINDGTEATLTVKADAMAPNTSAGPPSGPSAVANPPGSHPPYPGIPGRQLFPGRPGVPGFSFPARGRMNIH